MLDEILTARSKLLAAVGRYEVALRNVDEGPHAFAEGALEYADEQLGLAALELAQAWQASESKPVGWPADPAIPAADQPSPGRRLANVEVKGFRDLGVVAVSETTLAGEAFLHAESRDGSAADFPASSVHFIAWLPPGSEWPEKPRALASAQRYDTDYWDADADDRGPF